MKIRISLIILGLLDLCFCCNQFTNKTIDAEHQNCPIGLFRQKRTIGNYARWRGNIETTSEFLVKVFDEDITTARSKKVLAINIQPVTRAKEKIIVGGVVVPSTTQDVSPITPPLKDYTRFVPPTTLPPSHTNVIYTTPPQIPKIYADDLEPPLVPFGSLKSRIPYMNPNSRRDESPPASPQFIAKTPKLPVQFAALTPVGFSKRFTLTPVKPPKDLVTISQTPPTRTSTYSMPTRTRTAKQFDFDYPFFEDSILKKSPTRSSTIDIPTKTTAIYSDSVYNEAMDAIGDLAKKNFILNNLSKYKDSIHEKVTKKEPENVQILYDDKTDDDNEYSGDLNASSKGVTKVKTDEENPSSFSNIVIQTFPAWKTTTGKLAYDDSGEESMRNPKQMFALIRKQEANNLSQEKEEIKKERNFCSLLKLRPLNFHSPRTLYEIKTQLKHWADESPVAKLIDITDGNLTTMENPIYMMVVDDPSSGQIISAKQTVMVVAGIQGRDHHAVTAAIYLLYQLIERSESNVDLLSKYRFWIIPVFNPDGYDYSITFPQHRDWSKNLRQNWDVCNGRASCRACEYYGLRCTIQACYGVSLDRNFEYQWIPHEELRSEHPCGNLYAGARQLSEPETRALTTFLHDKWTPLHTFIAFKEGDVLGVMYPYSHTKKKRTLDHIYRQRASRAASAAYSISGRQYVAGQTSEFLPLYAGGIEDWVDGHLGVDHTYTIMMYKPTDIQNAKFATERIVHEAFAAADTLLLQTTEVDTLTPPPIKLVSHSDGTSSTIPPLTILIAFMSSMFVSS